MGKGVQYSGDPVILGIRRSLLHVMHHALPPALPSVISPSVHDAHNHIEDTSHIVNSQHSMRRAQNEGTAPWQSGCAASACVSALTARDSPCVTKALLGTKYFVPADRGERTRPCAVLTELFQCDDAVFNRPTVCRSAARSHISVVGVASSHSRRRASLANL